MCSTISFSFPSSFQTTPKSNSMEDPEGAEDITGGSGALCSSLISSSVLNPVTEFDRQLVEKGAKASVKSLVNAKVAFLRQCAQSDSDAYHVFSRHAENKASRKRCERRERFLKEVNYIRLNVGSILPLHPRAPSPKLPSLPQARRLAGSKNAKETSRVCFQLSHAKRLEMWLCFVCCANYAALLGPMCGQDIVDCADPGKLMVMCAQRLHTRSWDVLSRVLRRWIERFRARKRNEAMDMVLAVLHGMRGLIKREQLMHFRVKVIRSAKRIQRFFRTHRRYLAAAQHILHRQWLKIEASILALSWEIIARELSKDENLTVHPIAEYAIMRENDTEEATLNEDPNCPQLPKCGDSRFVDAIPCYSPAGMLPFGSSSKIFFTSTVVGRVFVVSSGWHRTVGQSEVPASTTNSFLSFFHFLI